MSRMSLRDGPTRRELLELEIDIRLADLWRTASELDVDARTQSLLLAFARAAYGRGYDDAVREPRGELMRAFGYPVPERAEADV